MTSIEWLKEKLFYDFGFAFSDNIYKQAKEMHKQEMETAYEEGYNRATKVIDDAVQRNILKDKL